MWTLFTSSIRPVRAFLREAMLLSFRTPSWFLPWLKFGAHWFPNRGHGLRPPARGSQKSQGKGSTGPPWISPGVSFDGYRSHSVRIWRPNSSPMRWIATVPPSVARIIGQVHYWYVGSACVAREFWEFWDSWKTCTEFFEDRRAFPRPSWAVVTMSPTSWSKLFPGCLQQTTCKHSTFSSPRMLAVCFLCFLALLF